ncbi:DUF58 domain-containing protein [bacterium]|nr:DUF58 domain-containing protein [bacterium]
MPVTEPATTPQELLKRVRRIEIATRAMVNHIFSGAYHSVFKGQGIEFNEVRNYQRGDDVRTIDWNVTARTGSLHVKRYSEERELTMVLAVDVSASTAFGSGYQSKAELAAEISALLAFSAIKNNDRVGLLLFSDQRERFVPPRKGRKHVMRIITEVLAHRTTQRKTNLNCALEFLARGLRRRSIVFLISDFYATDFTTTLKVAQRKHDCVAIVMNDKREYELPPLGWIGLTDPETGAEAEVDLRKEKHRREYERYAKARARTRLNYFAQYNVDAIDLFTDKSYILPLIQFFRTRRQKLVGC